MAGPRVPIRSSGFWPVTNANFENASYDQYASGFFLSKSMMKWFWDAYTTDARQRVEIQASPLLASPEQLKGLPPALVQTAENDVLRDEGEAYGKALQAAGVPTRIEQFDGMNHGFFFFVGIVDKSGTAMDSACEWVRETLAE